MTTVLNKILYRAVDLLYVHGLRCCVKDLSSLATAATPQQWKDTQLFVKPDRVVGKIRHVRPGGKRLIVAAKRRPERSCGRAELISHLGDTRARARRGGALPLHPCPAPSHPIGPLCPSRSPLQCRSKLTDVASSIGLRHPSRLCTAEVEAWCVRTGCLSVMLWLHRL